MARFLCIGDVHLGRRPSRLPEELLRRVPARSLGPAAAWSRAVDFALEEGVDGVLLAGDVVEQEDDFYEAYGELRSGVERLTAAGIRVVGVAGNHDVKVLPRLAEVVPGFTLLGRGGRWESVPIEADGGEVVRIVGWSFPESRFSESPIEAGLPRLDAETAVGLLHCDCDQAGSCYAPVRSEELKQTPVDVWALGHIHRPGSVETGGSIVYLGSLVGLDPGEDGVHGPWTLDVAAGRGSRWTQIPLAPLLWRDVEVSAEGLGSPGDVHAEIIRALNATARGQDLPGGVVAVGCRLVVSGRTRFRRELEEALCTDDPRELVHTIGDVEYFVHDWRIEASPVIALEELARQDDPVGILARRVLDLRGGGAGRRALLDEARPRLEGVSSHRYYHALQTGPLSDARIEQLLEEAALTALDALLAQRGDPS